MSLTAFMLTMFCVSLCSLLLVLVIVWAEVCIHASAHVFLV